MRRVLVVRTNGEDEEHQVHGNLLHGIYKLIDADCVDVVRLTAGRVMLVDDNGWEAVFVPRAHGGEMRPVRPRKPINAKATALYHAVTVPNDHQIAGDVAIVLDEDFAR